MTRSDRRTFLRRGAVALGAAGGLGATRGAAEAQAPAAPSTPAAPGLAERVAFDGPHQAGILTPRPAAAAFVALDAEVATRAQLAATLSALSARARSLTQGGRVALLEVDDPPLDSGILGPDVAPDGLTITIGFGASLFDDRFGLAKARPAGLKAMPSFAGDDLDPARTGGDVLLQINAHERDTVVHAVRELLRAVRGQLVVRWSLDAFSSAPRHPSPSGSPRNLFGFRDGTSNPDVSDPAEMDRLVWVGGDGGWTGGGTYMALRVIRMFVEFWDRVGLSEQQTMIGRDRATGAPLGGTVEHEDPKLETDPHGKRIPLDAHIRLANPRTAATDDQRLLRRPFNFHRGIDAAGQLDQGLAFVAFNQDLSRQFETVQKRLEAEPMVDYVTAVGGGYFFLPRGARGPADYVGSGAISSL